METLRPEFSVTSYAEHGEVHFTASGLWNSDTLQAFEMEMAKVLGPLVQTGKTLRFLADLRGLAAQDQKIASGIERLIEHSINMGNERTAIIADSTLTAMQHKRLNPTTNMKVFENRTDAVTWLRS